MLIFIEVVDRKNIPNAILKPIRNVSPNIIYIIQIILFFFKSTIFFCQEILTLHITSESLRCIFHLFPLSITINAGRGADPIPAVRVTGHFDPPTAQAARRLCFLRAFRVAESRSTSAHRAM